MSTHVSILVDYVGPPSAKVCCKARYAVLFQIRTFPPEPEDEAHIGPTVTYDEVIYPGFQHDITALQIQGYNISYNRHTCPSMDYNQMPSGKGKTHHSRNHTVPGSPPRSS